MFSQFRSIRLFSLLHLTFTEKEKGRERKEGKEVEKAKTVHIHSSVKRKEGS